MTAIRLTCGLDNDSNKIEIWAQKPNNDSNTCKLDNDSKKINMKA